MPATSLFGCRLRQLSADNTLFYALIAVVQVVWLFIYWIGIAAFARPQDCPPGVRSAPQQWIVVFVLLAFFIGQAALTLAAFALTLRGTPLEPATKRRWMGPLSAAYLLSLPINAGLLAWGGWVVLAGDGACWSGGQKSMPNSIMFGGFGVILGQAVGILVSYNQLGDCEHGNTWHAATRTGASSLLHLVGSFGAEHRGPGTVLEEIVTELQRLMAGIDGEKTDVVAGLACAALLQDEAAAGAAAAGGAAADAAVVVELGSSGAGKPQAQDPSQKSGGSGLAVGSTASPGLLAWAEGVCSGAAAALPAPGGTTASDEETADALHWARYATAAYGARQHAWRRGEQGGCAARRQLGRLAAAAAAEGAAPAAGWPSPPSRAQRRDFAAARDLLGPGCRIVSYHSGTEQQGLLPHLVAVDSERRAVVLAVAGNWRQPHAVPQATEALPDWLAPAVHGGAAAEAGAAAGMPACKPPGGGGSGSSSWVHKDSLEAAEALLAELDSRQLLHQLLCPGSGDSGATAGLAGLDCTGWRLVCCGHGLGAGAAALLALKLRAWQLGPLSVWAHGPPGQLCSADVAGALGAACTFTSVVLGDDASPRATAAALGRLVEQAVVGLARLRYSKFALLAALVAESLGPQRWRGRWFNPSRALRPVGEAPPEAVAYLQRFRDWQLQREEEGGAQKPGALPGRVLLLSRAPPGLPAAANGASSGSDSAQSGEQAGERWAATWAEGDEVAGWGVRVSRTALTDHYVSRLLSVLGGLAQRDAA